MSRGKVCVAGLSHLGTVYSCCLPNLGWTVVGWDADEALVASLAKGVPRVIEPGLAELLAKHVALQQLAFTTDPETAFNGACCVVLALDTPVDEQEEADLSAIEAISLRMADHLDDDVLVIVSSQVPVGTCQRLQFLIQQRNPNLRFGIAYCPENLRLGKAVACFLDPDRIVIGSDSPELTRRLEEFWSPIEAPRLSMSIRSAEMSKHALNAFLGTCISYANELANLCDEVAADALHVFEAVALDRRVGRGAPLWPGLGFGGGTLGRDLKFLQRLGNERGCETTLVDAVLMLNAKQIQVVLRKLQTIYPILADTTIGILGLAYKVGTNSLRRSPAIEIMSELARQRARIKAFDPQVPPTRLSEYAYAHLCADPYEVANDSDAIVIVTAWPQFANLDFQRMARAMRRAVLIDARNMLDPRQIREAGFLYFGVGRR